MMAPEDEMCTTVMEAARLGQLAEIERLIAEGHQTDGYDNRGWRAIHEAACANYVDCLNKLLQLDGTDVNWQSYDGVTALMVGCQNNHLPSAEMLLKAGASANIADHVDNYPLHEAVKCRNLTLVDMLVSHDAKVNCQLYCGTSPLHQSATEGMVDITRYLLEHGASLETKEDYNITPIFAASQYGQEECLKLMLQHATKQDKICKQHLVNYPAEDGATPLFLAAQEGHLTCVQVLLDHGADANIMTNPEPRALPLHAAMEFAHLDIVSALLPHTNQKFFKDCDNNPWYIVLANGSEKNKVQLVKLLVENGADVNYRHTRDMEDTYTRFPKILRFLPTESMLFYKCVSPLALATIFEKGSNVSQVIPTLIQNGAHVNAQRLYEFPPIISALEGRKINLVKTLIQAGASIDLYHPKLQGNFAVLLCMHQWKSIGLLLKLGAEVESMFDEAKYLDCLEKTKRHFDDCKRKQLHSVEKKDADHSEKCAVSGCSADSNDDSESNDIVEQSQLHILESISYIPFETFLVAARHVMSAGPYKVNISTVLYKLVYFARNVPVSEKLETFLDSERDIRSLRELTDKPRQLAHLCRLVVRKELGPLKLMNEADTRMKLFLPRNIWDYIYFSEIED